MLKSEHIRKGGTDIEVDKIDIKLVNNVLLFGDLMQLLETILNGDLEIPFDTEIEINNNQEINTVEIHYARKPNPYTYA